MQTTLCVSEMEQLVAHQFGGYKIILITCVCLYQQFGPSHTEFKSVFQLQNLGIV